MNIYVNQANYDEVTTQLFCCQSCCCQYRCCDSYFCRIFNISITVCPRALCKKQKLLKMNSSMVESSLSHNSKVSVGLVYNEHSVFTAIESESQGGGIDLTKSFSSILGPEYELEAGRDVFFLMMIGHFEFVSLRIQRSFIYFSYFRGTLTFKF